MRWSLEGNLAKKFEESLCNFHTQVFKKIGDIKSDAYYELHSRRFFYLVK